MEKDIKVRKVTQDVLRFVWFKHRILLEEPSPEMRFIPEISCRLMNNLCNAVWVESLLSDWSWRGFFQKHYKRMTSSFGLFSKYVYFACYTFNENSPDARTRLFDTLSLVTYFVLRASENGSTEFLKACVDLFCAFFEKELRTVFDGQGGWKNLNNYLEEQMESRNYKPLINANIRSFKQFYQQQDKHAECLERFESLYSVSLKKFTRTDVETCEKVVSLAESVAGKMEELRQQTFDEMLANFAETDSQVKKLYLQTVGKVSGGLAKEVEHISSQEVFENIPSNTKSEKELVKPIVTTSDPQKSDNFNFPKVDAPNKASHLIPKSEMARKFLSVISIDISKLKKLILSYCEEQGMQVPGQLETGSQEQIS